MGFETNLTQSNLVANLDNYGILKLINGKLKLNVNSMEINENFYAIEPITCGNFPFVFDAHNTQQQIFKMLIDINNKFNLQNKDY